MENIKLINYRSETLVCTVVQNNLDDIIITKPLKLRERPDGQTLYFCIPLWAKASSDKIFTFRKSETLIVKPLHEVVESYLSLLSRGLTPNTDTPQPPKEVLDAIDETEEKKEPVPMMQPKKAERQKKNSKS